MTISMKELWGSSHVSAGHAAYLETLYETFLKNPENLSCLLYTSDAADE